MIKIAVYVARSGHDRGEVFDNMEPLSGSLAWGIAEEELLKLWLAQKEIAKWLRCGRKIAKHLPFHVNFFLAIRRLRLLILLLVLLARDFQKKLR